MSNKNSFDDVLTLLKPTYESDKWGNMIVTSLNKRDVLCQVKSTVRSVFYDYGNFEHHPEYVVTINTVEYENEGFCILRGQRYTIIRTYEATRDLLELTLEVTNHLDEYKDD